MNTRNLILVAALTATPALARDFVTGNLVVSVVGDGSAALTSAATPVFLNEFTTGGSLVRSLALPTSASGANRRFTNSGSASSELALTRSTDGNYLTLVGYDAAPGLAGVASTASAATNRVVARISAFDIIDTTTALSDASTGNNVRSVASVDGTSFWVGGGAGGVRYATFGGTTSVQLSTTPTNVRVVNLLAGQLYTSNASGAFQGVSTVGTGLPTTSGQTATILPGFPTASGPSAYDYWLADASTMYVADDRATASGGGLQKWILSSGTWSLAYTMSTSLTAGLRGLTGTVDAASGNFLLYAVTADATANKLVSVIDSGAGSSFTTLATAPANTAFRGVDFAPVPTPGTLALLGLSGLAVARRRRTR